MNRFFVFMLVMTILAPSTGRAQEGRHALLIGGLGGSPEYREQYRSWLLETRQALLQRCRFVSEDITILAESRAEQDTVINGVSDAGSIRDAFKALSANAADRDDVFIILFGHGSFDGKNAVLNIPQADLKDADYAALAGAIHARRIVFINTASASAPFIDHVSAPDRIVITATRTGTERNETVFPRFLVEGLANENSDLDKNGGLTVFELFQYACDNTARFYTQSDHLETEHPLLEDTGDRRGFRAGELAANGEGGLARITSLSARATLLAGSAGPLDQQTAALLGEQETLIRDITALKAAKATLTEDAYYTKLEPLFVRLARISDQIDSAQE